MIKNNPWFWGIFFVLFWRDKEKKSTSFSLISRVVCTWQGCKACRSVSRTAAPVRSLKMCSMLHKDQGYRGLMLSVLAIWLFFPCWPLFEEMSLGWRGAGSIHQDTSSHLLSWQGSNSNYEPDLGSWSEWCRTKNALPCTSASLSAVQMDLGEITLRCLNLAFGNTPRFPICQWIKPEMIHTPILTQPLCLWCWMCSGPWNSQT